MATKSPLEIALRGGFDLGQHERLLDVIGPLLDLDQRRRLELDLSGLARISPAAFATLVAVITGCVQRGLIADGSQYTPPKNKLVSRYLSRMDFNKLLASEAVAEDFTRRDPVGFVPCNRFSRIDQLGELAESLTKAASQAMSPGSIERVAVYLAVLELAQNVLDHSAEDAAEHPPYGFAMAQLSHRSKEFEVAIADRGVGVPSSLRRNPAYSDVQSDLRAIELALHEGVTSRPDTSHNGVLLSSLERAVRDNGGVFMVRSGSALFESGGKGRRLDGLRHYDGTVTVFRVDTQKPFVFDRFRELERGPAAVAA